MLNPPAVNLAQQIMYARQDGDQKKMAALDLAYQIHHRREQLKREDVRLGMEIDAYFQSRKATERKLREDEASRVAVSRMYEQTTGKHLDPVIAASPELARFALDRIIGLKDTEWGTELQAKKEMKVQSHAHNLRMQEIEARQTSDTPKPTFEFIKGLGAVESEILETFTRNPEAAVLDYHLIPLTKDGRINTRRGIEAILANARAGGASVPAIDLSTRVYQERFSLDELQGLKGAASQQGQGVYKEKLKQLTNKAVRELEATRKSKEALNNAQTDVQVSRIRELEGQEIYLERYIGIIESEHQTGLEEGRGAELRGLIEAEGPSPPGTMEAIGRIVRGVRRKVASRVRSGREGPEAEPSPEPSEAINARGFTPETAQKLADGGFAIGGTRLAGQQAVDVADKTSLVVRRLKARDNMTDEQARAALAGLGLTAADWVGKTADEIVSKVRR